MAKSNPWALSSFQEASVPMCNPAWNCAFFVSSILTANRFVCAITNCRIAFNVRPPLYTKGSLLASERHARGTRMHTRQSVRSTRREVRTKGDEGEGRNGGMTLGQLKIPTAERATTIVTTIARRSAIGQYIRRGDMQGSCVHPQWVQGHHAAGARAPRRWCG